METKTENFFLKVDFEPIKILFWLDIVGRAGLCYLYFFNFINVWLFLGIFVGTLIMLATIHNKIDGNYKRKLREAIGSTALEKIPTISINYNIKDTLISIYAIMGLVGSFWFFYKVISPEHWYTYILIFFLGFIGTAFFILTSEFILFPKSFEPLKFSVMKTTSIVSRKGHSDRTPQTTATTTDVSHDFAVELMIIDKAFDFDIVVDPMDVNDTEIARLESDLKDMNTRVDAYMLEGVLIGSLTFSGFLTIVASGLAKGNQLNEIDYAGLPNAHNLRVYDLLAGLDQWSTTANVCSLIMVESLFCSVFFILVLALRMRFGRLSLKFDYLIRIMSIFNAKEEELINLQLSQDDTKPAFQTRRKNLAFKISEAINDANKLSKDLKPLTKLMTLYRNIGLILFFLILATSGFFFSAKVGLTILLIALGTWLFRVVETWRSLDKIKRLLQRH